MKNIEVIPLFSGSRGNSTLVRCGKTAILIDAGVLYKRLEKKLKSLGVKAADLKGILVTHSHHDHVYGLGEIVDNTLVPIFAEEKTIELLGDHGGRINSLSGEQYVENVKVTFFPLSHDVPCVGYKIEYEGESFCYLTDTGVFCEENFGIISGSDAVMVESNHDVDMLENGCYPYMLKKRIRSPYGHLSNADCAVLCGRLYESGTREFILGHLSEENNCPELAYSATDEVLKSKGDDYLLFVARRNGYCECVSSEGEK